MRTSGLLHGNSTLLFTVEARRQLAAGLPHRAIETCKLGLARYPDHSVGYLVLAAAYRAAGEEERARLVLTRGYERTGLERLRELAEQAESEGAPQQTGAVDARSIETEDDTPAMNGHPEPASSRDEDLVDALAPAVIPTRSEVEISEATVDIPTVDVAPLSEVEPVVELTEAEEAELQAEADAAVEDLDVTDVSVSEPEMSWPEVSEPEVSEPEVSEPEVSEPGMSTREDDVAETTVVVESAPAASASEATGPAQGDQVVGTPASSAPDEPVVRSTPEIVSPSVEAPPDESASADAVEDASLSNERSQPSQPAMRPIEEQVTSAPTSPPRLTVPPAPSQPLGLSAVEKPAERVPWFQRRGARAGESTRPSTLALHSGKSAHRLRSANLRLIPGLEFAPLRAEEQTRGRLMIAPIMDEPLPDWEPRRRTAVVDEAPPLPEYPPVVAPAEPASPAPARQQPARPASLEEPAASSARPGELGEILGRIEQREAVNEEVEDISAIDELARRLEGAKIASVGEAPAQHRHAFEPAIVSDTLAEILVKQGAYGEAMKAFMTLARTRPDKLRYYEERIAEMKQRLIEEREEEST